GDTACDARQHEAAGVVTEIDPGAGYVVLKRGKGTEPATPGGLVVNSVVGTDAQQASLLRLAEDTLAGKDTMGLALLEGRVPGGMTPRPVALGSDVLETSGEVVRRVGAQLERQVLPVQGPPGSGKSHSGKALIRDLLGAGLRVGVTANSHAVI